MAHCKMANAITSLHRIKRKFTAFDLPSIVRVTFASLCLSVILSGAAQARDETRVSFSQGVQLNHNDRHAHPSAWWLTPRHNAHAHAEPYHHTRYSYSRWRNRLSPNSSLSISWGNSPYYQNKAAYRHPRWHHWNGFDDRFEDSVQDSFNGNYVITPWPNNWRSQQYQQAGRYEQALEVLSPTITRVSTQISHSTGLTSLPANAKVMQLETGTVYEWQGVLYRFDWTSQTYQVTKAQTD